MRLGFASLSSALAVAILSVMAYFGPLHQSAKADIENDMVLGVDLPHGDIQRISLRGPDPGLCRQACDQNPQCRGWTFLKPGAQEPGAVCWLKGTLPAQSVINRAAISGVKPSSGGPLPGHARTDSAMIFGVDLHGEDLQSFALQRADPAMCQNACENNPQCRAWTFIKPGVQGPPICWLKRGVPQAVHVNHLISGLRKSPLPPSNQTATRPGGGATGTGTDWGVWASAAGGKWNDPCAILYNAAQIANNRYDGNPGYKRVRTRATQREADLDINHFGRFHGNNPDGVVKMVACNPNAGGNTAGGGNPGGNTGGGGGNYTQWMTGQFNSTFGKMSISPSGGTYEYHGGTIQVTRIDGPVMEGIWREATGAPCPGGGGHSGRFRFTFNATGFGGIWGHCDGPLNAGSWGGGRQ